MVGHQVFRASLERLINIKHVPLRREVKQRLVETVQSAPQAVNIDHPCRRIRVWAETDRVHPIGEVVATASNYFTYRIHASFEANEHVIESFQDVQVTSANDRLGGVQFIQPTYAYPASVLPTLQSIHVKHISKSLEAAKKQVVFLSEPDRTKAGVDGRQHSSHILPQKPTLAFFPKPEAHAG